jgi:peptide/nickel transport system substrate-binding protein
LNLRKGVKFHDGTPFTADDVIFTLASVSKGDGSDVKTYVGQIKQDATRSTTMRSTS